MTFLDYFYWKGLLSLTIFIVIHLRHSWASSSDDRGNPIPRIDRNKLIDWFIGRHFNVLEHQYGRRDVMWKRFIRKSTQKMETNKVHFKFVSQIKDDANARHMQYQSLCVVLILFQLRSHFLMLLSFFFLSRCWMEETKFTFTCNLLECHFFACGT